MFGSPQPLGQVLSPFGQFGRYATHTHIIPIHNTDTRTHPHTRTRTHTATHIHARLLRPAHCAHSPGRDVHTGIMRRRHLRIARSRAAGEWASARSMKGLPCGDSGSEMNRLAATSASAFRLAAAIAEILVRPSVCRRALWPEIRLPNFWSLVRRAVLAPMRFLFKVGGSLRSFRGGVRPRGLRGVVENLHSGGRRRAVHAQ